MALKSKMEVLPVGVIDSFKVLPRGAMFPRFVRCEIKIGKPIKFNNKKTTKKVIDETTRSIMKQIAKLINQKYSY